MADRLLPCAVATAMAWRGAARRRPNGELVKDFLCYIAEHHSYTCCPGTPLNGPYSPSQQQQLRAPNKTCAEHCRATSSTRAFWLPGYQHCHYDQNVRILPKNINIVIGMMIWLKTKATTRHCSSGARSD